MIRAKNCEKLSKFVEVTPKILSVPFFWDMVYINFISWLIVQVTEVNVKIQQQWCIAALQKLHKLRMN